MQPVFIVLLALLSPPFVQGSERGVHEGAPQQMQDPQQHSHYMMMVAVSTLAILLFVGWCCLPAYYCVVFRTRSTWTYDYLADEPVLVLDPMPHGQPLTAVAVDLAPRRPSPPTAERFASYGVQTDTGISGVRASTFGSMPEDHDLFGFFPNTSEPAWSTHPERASLLSTQVDGDNDESASRIEMTVVGPSSWSHRDVPNPLGEGATDPRDAVFAGAIAQLGAT